MEHVSPPRRAARIRELFDELADLSPEARRHRLQEIGAEDPTLQQEVGRLLDLDERAGRDPATGMLDVVRDVAAFIVRAGPGMAEMPLPEMPAQVGPYRIVRVLGHGGMGTVYLAERSDVNKRVALKLVRAAAFSPEIRQRFLHERRILAALDHPRIARLLDAGMTPATPGRPEDAVPYFAMEYVEGEPITDYCAHRGLGLQRRLRLFLQVCDAVAYAHRSLVIHRDLKPSNILVAEDEQGAPQVKLLDFGIAKIVVENEVEAGRPDLTRTGMQVMTPQYAAPEQVRGLPVTTATDVYALGLLLYELLTGRRPYRVDALSPSQVERVVCDTLPSRPSQAVLHPPADGRPAAVRLHRQLRGDLDAIVLTALQKEPERRYASAERLAQDVGRHLAGKRVLARPDALAYRAGKFVRRHRWSVATAAIFVVLLAGYAATVTLQARRITAERDRAEQALARSENVKEFLIDLFEASSPVDAPGDTLTARDLLRRGIVRADALEDAPDVQAEMLDAMGEAHVRLGWFDDAERLHEQALALRRTLYGETHEKVAESMDHLAWVFVNRGRYDAAETLARQALEARRALLGEEHVDVARSFYVLASAVTVQGRHDEAEQLYRRALDLRRRLLGETHAEVDRARFMLAQSLWRLDRLDEAEPMVRQTLDAQRARLGETHPDVANGVELLGNILGSRGDPAASEEQHRVALELNRRLYGERHWRFAQSLRRLASAVSAQGDHAGAEALHRQALALTGETLGETHPAYAAILSALAFEVSAQGRYDEAEQLQRRSCRIRRQTLDADHPAVLEGDIGLGRMLTDHEKYAAADSVFQGLMATVRRSLKEDDPFAATIMSNYARLRLQTGDFPGAEALYLEALALRRRWRGETHPHTTGTLERLVALYEQWGRPDEAQRYRAMVEQP